MIFILSSKPVASTLSLSPSYEEDFRVTLQYPNGTVTEYVPEHDEVKLQYNAPFYDTVKWTGTYDLPNGASVEINSPIHEEAEVSLNYYFVLVPAIALAIALFLALRRHP